MPRKTGPFQVRGGCVPVLRLECCSYVGSRGLGRATGGGDIRPRIFIGTFGGSFCFGLCRFVFGRFAPIDFVFGPSSWSAVASIQFECFVGPSCC